MSNNTTPGLVSVITPVYNRPIMVQEAIESVVAQTYPHYEIIIVNDGSTDETADVLNQLQKSHAGKIKIIQQENRGPGVARETGRVAAKGEFIQYLDSDDLLEPTKFEQQVKGLQEHLDCDVSYGITRVYDYGGTKFDKPIKRTGERIETMFPSFLTERWWSTSTPLFRSRVTNEIGSWLPISNEEDWEYDCRVAAEGGRLHYTNTFVSDTRIVWGNRQSLNGTTDKKKLASRAVAHKNILDHALKAGVSVNSAEMQHFARELFLLARQCGAAGLELESRYLFELSKKVTAKPGWDYRLYKLIANVLGWNSLGKIACMSDKFRT